METKASKLRALMAAEAWPAALAMAAKFPRLGKHRAAILDAHEAIVRPDFMRAIGRTPETLINKGIEALIAAYSPRQ